MKEIFKKIIIPILTWQAMHLLGRFNPKIIGITGSVGKTSTKEAIYHFLKSNFNVRKSEKSFNSEIGVPLAILGLKTAWSNPFGWMVNLIKGFFISFFSKKYPEILVLEIGADKKGDIENIVEWLRPDIGVLTLLPDVPVHLENFPSIEDVYKEKIKLLEALPKEGIAILNADDHRLMQFKERLNLQHVITFGIKNKADVSPDLVSVPKFANPYPALAGAALAIALGMQSEEVKALSYELETPPGRMRELRGINNSVIIDDTYNSSPVALESALNTLDKTDTEGRKIAVLGDMMELGEFGEAEHRRIGNLAIDSVDMLITVGERAKWIFDEAKRNRNEHSRLRDFKICEDSTEAGIYLKNLIIEGDIILIKGSQSMRMEKTVLAILESPEKDKNLLVRQDKEWQNR